MQGNRTGPGAAERSWWRRGDGGRRRSVVAGSVVVAGSRGPRRRAPFAFGAGCRWVRPVADGLPMGEASACGTVRKGSPRRTPRATVIHGAGTSPGSCPAVFSGMAFASGTRQARPPRTRTTATPGTVPPAGATVRPPDRTGGSAIRRPWPSASVDHRGPSCPPWLDLADRAAGTNPDRDAQETIPRLCHPPAPMPQSRTQPPV